MARDFEKGYMRWEVKTRVGKDKKKASLLAILYVSALPVTPDGPANPPIGVAVILSHVCPCLNADIRSICVGQE